VRQAPGCHDLVGMRLGHGMRTETAATRIWFVTTGYLVRLLAHHPEIFNDHTHLVIDEVSYYYYYTLSFFIATYCYCVFYTTSCTVVCIAASVSSVCTVQPNKAYV
jgi:hypothetical protein